MIFNIQAFGMAVNQNTPDRKAGIAVKIDCKDEYGRQTTRTMSFPIGVAANPRADLLAIEYALRSIKDQFKNSRIDLYISPYATEILEKNDAGDYVVLNPKDHPTTASEMRDIADSYDNLNVMPYSEEAVSIVKEEAIRCAETQQGKDSKTILKA